MPITIQCPNLACNASASVPESVAGRPVKCKKCGTPFKATRTLDGAPGDTARSASIRTFASLPAEFGRYRILKKLGQGGMGAVYLAEDSQLGRKVALKLPSFPASESKRLERFVREAKSSAGLQHPNICAVYDAGQIDGRPFISMAHIDGRTLDDEIDPDRPMEQGRAAGIVRKIALALHEAHANGIVHRDLKPANVMISAKGEPVVMDFGLAKRLDERDLHEARLTREGAVMGTPAYMAPEQVRGELDRIGPATDVYALGVMLYEMLTGRTPYGGPVGVVMAQILTAPVPLLRTARPDADPRLEELCRQAMSKDVSERPPSMAAFAEQLEDYLKDRDTVPTATFTTPSVTVPVLPPPSAFDNLAEETEEVVQHSPTGQGRRSRKAKSRPTRWPLAAGAVALGLLLLGAVVVFAVRTKHGEVVIELSDPAAKVEVKVDGERIELTGLAKPLNLTVGEHGLTVQGSDFEAVTQSFTVRNGDRQVVKVTLKPKTVVSQGPKPKETAPNPAKTDPPRAGSIPADAVTLGTSAFKVFPDVRSWKAAKIHCSSLGGRLAVIKSEGQNRLASRLIAEAGLEDAWIGATDEAEEGKWVWTDGTPLTYTNWGPSQPNNKMMNEHFALIWLGANGVNKANGSWSDQPDVAASHKPGCVCEWVVPPPKQEQGFVPLFNGKDLTGWKPEGAATWSWTAGRLLGSPGVGGGAGYLMTDADYDDFELELQYKLAPGGGSGLFLRGNPNGVLNEGSQMEAQILDDGFPQFAKAQATQKTGALYGVFPPKTDPPVKRNDWNTMRVRLVRRKIEIWVNGVQTVDADLDAPTARDQFDKKPGLTRATGRIGLQQQITDIEFRDVKIKRLGG